MNPKEKTSNKWRRFWKMSWMPTSLWRRLVRTLAACSTCCGTPACPATVQRTVLGLSTFWRGVSCMDRRWTVPTCSNQCQQIWEYAALLTTRMCWGIQNSCNYSRGNRKSLIELAMMMMGLTWLKLVVVEDCRFLWISILTELLLDPSFQHPSRNLYTSNYKPLLILCRCSHNFRQFTILFGNPEDSPTRFSTSQTFLAPGHEHNVLIKPTFIR